MHADLCPLGAKFSEAVTRIEAQPIEARRLKTDIHTATLRGKNAATKIENNSKIFAGLIHQEIVDFKKSIETQMPRRLRYGVTIRPACRGYIMQSASIADYHILTIQTYYSAQNVLKKFPVSIWFIYLIPAGFFSTFFSLESIALPLRREALACSPAIRCEPRGPSPGPSALHHGRFMTASALPLAPSHSRIVQLDGLRAIAVLAVFAQHALKAPLWMGVDLFFVLSGFLISGILLDRKSRQQSYFRYFYTRRARRILPPYLLLMAVSSVLFGLAWAQHWYWYAFFATNIGDALNQSGHDSLNVLWSLAVEEQFYIFWPFVILLVPERLLGYVAAALIVLVPLLRALATPWFDSFWPIYYLTPFRMDLLAAGALLAVAVRRDRNALESFKGLAVLGALAALAVLAWLHLHFPRFRAANTPLSNAGLYSVSLVLCTSIVVIALQSKGIVKRLLCNRVLVYVGTISYTIYLIHLSVLYMVWPLHLNRYLSAAIALAITLVYASITWFAFEKRLIFGARGARTTTATGANVARQTPQSRA